MKLKSLFFAATAAMMLASCSSDEPNIINEEQHASDGYIAVAINLPNQPTPSRAANDVYDDGTEDEYAVDNGVLLLFTGADEASATFHSAYQLSGFSKVDDADKDNISVSYLKAVQVSNIPSGNLFGLVLLNCESVGSVSGTDFVLYDNTTKVSSLATLTGHACSRAFYTGKGNSAKHFFMANAPLSTVKGGVQNVTVPSLSNVFTLVNLTNSVKPTEQAAKDAPAGSFYVERAVAKASLTFTADAFTGKDKDGNDYTLDVKEKKWALTNVEDQSFIVRNMGTFDYMGYRAENNYRMAGSINIGETSIQPNANPELYRTYFCIDPKYSDPKAFQTTDEADFTTTDQPEYCYENTFNVTNMTPQNTTAAVIAVTFGDGNKNFWILNDDRETIYTSVDDAASTAKVYICNSMIVKNAIAAVMPANSTINYTGAEVDSFLKITWKRDDNTGLLYIDTITMEKTADMLDTPVVDAEGIKKLNEEIAPSYRIAQYNGGKSYYTVLIKHFGDDLTPWSTTQTSTPSTTASYGADAEKYLGRYGMVRNNWYELKVSKIVKIGSPVVPNINVTTPDDEKNDEKWLAFKINVLSWAKRVQTSNLGE